MKDDDANNTDDPALDFIRQIIRRACWAVSYHEVRLPIVYRNSKFAQNWWGGPASPTCRAILITILI